MYYREDFYKKLGAMEKKGSKEKVSNICDLLKIIPGDYDLSRFQSVRYILSLSPKQDSRLDLSEDEQLQNVIDDLRKWVGEHHVTAESCAVEYMNRRTKSVLVVFLVVIIAAALAAIACTVAHIMLGDAGFPMGNTIAEVIGTCDFALGVLAFVIERFDDMDKKEIRLESQKVSEGGEPKKFVDKCVRGVSVKIAINIGMFNKIDQSEDKSEHNYYN